MKHSFGNSKAAFKIKGGGKDAIGAQHVGNEGDAAMGTFGTSLANGRATCSRFQKQAFAMRNL